MIMKLLSVLVGVMLMVFASVCQAQLVQNGSFEQGYPPTGDGNYIPLPDSVSLPGWTYTSIDWVFNLWQAAEGTKSLDLNGSSAGLVSQSFVTDLNQPYKLHFSLSGNPFPDQFGGSPALKTLTLSLTGLQDQAYAFDTNPPQPGESNSPGNMKWQEKIVDFNGVGGQTTLAFTSTTAGAAGPALDNVWVEKVSSVAVPEPSVLSLLACGLVGLLVTRRRLGIS
jgi:choice-of-anchor C domain-containing protein